MTMTTEEKPPIAVVSRLDPTSARAVIQNVRSHGLDELMREDTIQCAIGLSKGELAQVVLETRAPGSWRGYIETLKRERESAAAKAAMHAERGADKRRQIEFSQGHLDRAVEEAIEALAVDENVFQSAKRLVTVIREPPRKRGVVQCEQRSSIDVECPSCSAAQDEPCERDRRHGRSGTPRLCEISEATLRVRLSKIANFMADNGAGLKDILPPVEVVSAVLRAKTWRHIRSTQGIVEAPIVRSDGSILQGNARYDPSTELCYAPTCDFPRVPSKPTREQCRAALKRLWIEAFCDFPFAGMPGHDPADKSRERRYSAACLCPGAFVPVAGCATLAARPAIDGAVMSIAFEAATMGTGKTRLLHATSMIATGRPAGVSTFPMRGSQPNDDELEKKLAGFAVGGAALVAFDNVKGSIGGAALEKAQTAEGDIVLRVLGKTGEEEHAWNALVAITGNNMTMTADVAQRTLVCRLESPLEDPRSRPPAEFRHPNLLAKLRELRPQLHVDILTVLVGYMRAPAAERDAVAREVGVQGSFECWTSVVAHAIRWAGGPNVLDSIIKGATDPKSSAHMTLMRMWPDAFAGGVTSSSFIAHAFAHEYEIGVGKHEPDGLDDLRSAIRELTSAGPSQRPSPQQLTAALNDVRDAWRDGARIVGAENKHTKVLEWRIVRRDEAPRVPVADAAAAPMREPGEDDD